MHPNKGGGRFGSWDLRLCMVRVLIQSERVQCDQSEMNEQSGEPHVFVD